AELKRGEGERTADDPAVAKQLVDLVGMRRGADVEVLGAAAEEEVADAAADEVGDVLELPQPVEDAQRIGIHVAPRDHVLVARNDPRFNHRTALYPVLPSRIMRRRAACILLTGLLFARPVAAAADPLAKARQLYNQRDFEAAIVAAEQARLLPGRSDVADLVGARAYLERFRDSQAPDDLTNARDRLRRLSPERFGPLERSEYLIGLGETL